jgi:branched-chain amino acid transport system substrate-binding protein
VSQPAAISAGTTPGCNEGYVMQKKSNLPRRAVLAGATVGLAGLRAARAQTPVIRIGVLTDLAGPYRDNGGLTSIACAQQAVEDLGVAGRGIRVEIVSADHQNKPDVGLNIARKWFDNDGVDAVAEVNNSSIAMAINNLVTEKNKVHLCTGAASVDLTGSNCSPNMVHWLTDTWSDAQVADAVMKQGGDKWFFIASDYTSGHLLQKYTAEAVEKAGGKVMGSAYYPFPDTTDFSSFLLQAQASGANTIGFCNAGIDLVNCIKQAHEFGLAKLNLVGVVTYITNIHSLGLTAAQGLLLTEGFYWDMNDRTSGFTKRVTAKAPDNWPNSEHAATYGAVVHYLKAINELGVPRAKASGLEVVKMMKHMPTDDDCFGPGSIRADGRVMLPLYLFRVKSPAESHGPWDLYKQVGTIPAEQARRPMNEGGCKVTPAFSAA